jgi:cytochrome P450
VDVAACLHRPAFAMQEATLVLATIARHFNFAVAPGHAVWPMHSVTLRPEGGMPMTVAPR